MHLNILKHSENFVKLSGMPSLLGKGIQKGVAEPAIDLIKKVLIGSKSITGPFRGTHWRAMGPAKELKSWGSLTPRALSRLSPAQKKLVKKLDLGGMKVPMLRKKRLGGVAGMAHKYPYHTAGLGGLYYLSKKNKGHLVSPVPYEQLAMLRQQVPDYRPVPPIRGTF